MYQVSIKMNCILQLFLFDLNQCKSEYEFQRKQLRIREHAICLLRNCCDPSIKSLHIFVDTNEAKEFYSQITNPYGEKATYILHGRQPTYKDLVDYAKQTFSDGELVCIMNSDMIFNSQKDHALIQKIAKPKRLISLTRHEFTDENHSICTRDTCPFTHDGGSSDVFIFVMPIDSKFDTSSVDHKQNMFSAEAVFHKAWTTCGYEIVNPCDDIITIHIHKDRVHFQAYEYLKVDNDLTTMNWRTPLPPEAQM
jgi:hypothetical protein